MKKLIATFTFMVIALTAFAQSNSEHLTFKGVPIDGTLNEYVAKMENAGFSHIDTKDGVAILSGEFAGYKDCIIGVMTFQKCDLVHEITVLFPRQNTWKGLDFDYNRLKSMLSKKYGKPDKCVEKFVHFFEDDDIKMSEVKNNNCTYYSVFKIENGNISLSIENVYYGVFDGCRVKLWYSDKINSKAFEEAAIDDL